MSQYVVQKKKLGTKSTSTLFDFSENGKISDMAFIEENTFLFSVLDMNVISSFSNNKYEEQFIGQRQSGTLSEILKKNIDVKFPTSLYFDRISSMLYCVNALGIDVLEFTFYNRYAKSALSNGNKSIMAQELSDILNINNIEFKIKTAITGDDRNIYICNSFLNKCYVLSGSNLSQFCGSGKRDYTSSSDILYTSFNSPSGLLVSNGILFISDTENNCIRLIDISDRREKPVIGIPLDNKSPVINPSKIINYKDLIYIMDLNTIKCYSQKTKHFNTIIESKNIISFDIDLFGNILYLEKI